MQVIEANVVGKLGTSELCEDALFYNDDWAVVIDGCSSAKKNVSEALPQGVIARDICLAALATLPADADCQKAFEHLNLAFVRWYEKQGILATAKKESSIRPCAYLALLSIRRREVWVLGDCQALVNGTLVTTHKAVDSLMENLRSFLLEAGLLSGKQERYSSLLEPIKALQPLFQNNQSPNAYSYATLDGFFSDYQAIKIFHLPKTATEVVLATDGYPQLKASLSASEEALQGLLARDPLCFRENRQTKGMLAGQSSFDDRAYLRILV